MEKDIDISIKFSSDESLIISEFADSIASDKYWCDSQSNGLERCFIVKRYLTIDFSLFNSDEGREIIVCSDSLIEGFKEISYPIKNPVQLTQYLRDLKSRL